MSTWIVVAAIFFSGALSALAIPVLIKAGHRYGLLDQPGQHKRHKKPTPFLGGVALFAVSWISILVFALIVPAFRSEFGGSLFYIFVGALIILLVGLSDDLSPLSAWVKLAAQVAAGLVLYLGGLNVELLSTPFGSIEIGGFSVLI
ncbi:MAG TPA: hypothetical protein VJ983_07985, partial [candidate division Zixibacteria bacterium]|nr:hypothetical protein [candidate division Zixibacteria bacterium]